MMENAKHALMSRPDMENRRLDAARDLLEGTSQARVARSFGVSRTTASRWHRAVVERGVESLRRRRATGRPSRLTADQLARIPEIFAAGPAHFGFEGSRWTTARMAVAIEAELGVRYDRDHVGRLMHKLGLAGRSAARVAAPAYAESRYSPNTARSLSDISPTVA